jgi:hypothetical protein
MNSLPPRSDEWTTVAPKKTSSYVPPHLRKALTEAEKKKPIDMKSKELFPTLCTAPVQSTVTTWDSKKSFKEKIDGLIALEAMTEREKQLREEAKRAMEGWVTLSLKLTPEVRAQLEQRRVEREAAYDAWNYSIECGTQGLISLENYIPKATKTTTVYVQEDLDNEEDDYHIEYPNEED